MPIFSLQSKNHDGLHIIKDGYYLHGVFVCSNDFKEAFDQITADELWTKGRVKELEKAYLDLPHINVCVTRETGGKPQVSRICAEFWLNSLQQSSKLINLHFGCFNEHTVSN